MGKTSFRMPDDTSAALAELAEKCHGGNRTTALVEAIRQYHGAQFGGVAGWITLRFTGKRNCAKCNANLDGMGQCAVGVDGRIAAEVRCEKCARSWLR